MYEKNGEELFESTYKNGISSGYKKKEIFLESKPNTIIRLIIIINLMRSLFIEHYSISNG